MLNAEELAKNFTLGELLEMNTSLTIQIEDMNRLIPQSSMAALPEDIKKVREDILAHTKIQKAVRSAMDIITKKNVKYDG